MKRTSSMIHPAGRRTARAAFSLVEVTLAIGIISVSALAVVALLPLGLSTMRQAMDHTVEAQIATQLGSEATLTPFSALATKYDGKTTYYDAEGRRESALTSRTRYWAVTSLTNAGYPGSAIPTAITNSVVTLRFDLISTPGGGAAFKSTNTYTIRVANSGN
ncbi:MAG TPA: Verru_Chthon cassette protein B [Candidatus Methylacidiphilales bacterium]|nr:Verru_Chthon cassette protein B [Candidatus Methylacidiphilales bacterium]